VFGPNGAGKTTLLRVLATLLRPHAGSVRVLGSALPQGRVGRARADRAARHEPLLYRELTARENLRFHARLHGVAEERVEELLAAVRIDDRADEPLRMLSRGMVQRVAVARAVLHDPELLLLDEPRSNLDPAAVELVDPLIGAGAQRTRVICSHDPGGGLAEADVVLGLRAGRVALVRDAAAVAPEEIAEPVSMSAAIGQTQPAAERERPAVAGARGTTPTRAVVGALLRKELRVELRTLESVPAMSLFAVTTFVVFHFALNRNTVDGDLAAGILWVTLLFAAISASIACSSPTPTRAGLRRVPARARRPQRAAAREGRDLALLPGCARADRRSRLRPAAAGAVARSTRCPTWWGCSRSPISAWP